MKKKKKMMAAASVVVYHIQENSKLNVMFAYWGYTASLAHVSSVH